MIGTPYRIEAWLFRGGIPICPDTTGTDRFLEVAREYLEGTLIALDVDGTISAIAPSPSEAEVTERMRGTLRRLSERCHLWFVSGRDADAAQRMVGVTSAGYIGAHGLEVLDGQGLRPLTSASDVRPQLQQLARMVVASVPDVAPYVERKRWSVAFHYRAFPASSPIPAQLRRIIEEQLPAGLRLRPGKMVLEAIPAIDHDKGTALRWLIDTIDPKCVLAAGDDLTDVAMFQALAERRRRTGIDALSVAVLQEGETPPPVIAAADTTVDGVWGLHGLFQRLVEGEH